MSHKGNDEYLEMLDERLQEDAADIRLEHALAYLKMCGYTIVEPATIIENQCGAEGGIVLEANNGEIYRHTYQECIDFYEAGSLPEESDAWRGAE